MILPAFWSYQDHKEIPFLLKMRSEWQETKPLAGMRILHNTPLTLDTLCKVDVLLQAGAIVTLTRTKSIRPIVEEKTYPYISALGIEYIPEHDMLQGRDNEFEDDLEQTESFRLALPAYQASYHALSDLEPIQIILPN